MQFVKSRQNSLFLNKVSDLIKNFRSVYSLTGLSPTQQLVSMTFWSIFGTIWSILDNFVLLFRSHHFFLYQIFSFYSYANTEFYMIFIDTSIYMRSDLVHSRYHLYNSLVLTFQAAVVFSLSSVPREICV